MKVSRGKRQSLIVEAGRYRARITIGRFQFGYEHDRPGVWIFSGKVFLLTVLRRNRRPVNPATEAPHG